MTTRSTMELVEYLSRRGVPRYLRPAIRCHAMLSDGSPSAQLAALVKTCLKRMQYRPGLLEGFLASTGLHLTPFRNTHH